MDMTILNATPKSDWKASGSARAQGGFVGIQWSLVGDQDSPQARKSAIWLAWLADVEVGFHHVYVPLYPT